MRSTTICCILLVLVVAQGALALGPLGAPCAKPIGPGMDSLDRSWTLGLGAFQSDDSLDVDSWLFSEGGVEAELEQRRYYLSAGYGNCNWEVRGNIGLQQTDWGTDDCCTLLNIPDEGDGFAGGASLAHTFRRLNSQLRLGWIIGIDYIDSELDRASGQVGVVTASVAADVQIFDPYVGIGLTANTKNERFVGWTSLLADYPTGSLDADVTMPLGNSFSEEADLGDSFRIGIGFGVAGGFGKDFALEIGGRFFFSDSWAIGIALDYFTE